MLRLFSVVTLASHEVAAVRHSLHVGLLCNLLFLKATLWHVRTPVAGPPMLSKLCLMPINFTCAKRNCIRHGTATGLAEVLSRFVPVAGSTLAQRFQLIFHAGARSWGLAKRVHRRQKVRAR